MTAIANEFRWLAFAWHLLLAALLLAGAVGWRPSQRFIGTLLALPFVTASALAWRTGNPFNGTLLATLALALAVAATRFPVTPAGLAPRPFVVAGVAMVLFGATYPHFLAASAWYEYLHSAPFGLVPCPTLSVAIGITLILGLFRSTSWTVILSVTGLLYGVLGVARLEVALDWGLLAGVSVLAFAGARARPAFRSVRATPGERSRVLPGDDLIADPLASLTHAITIARPPRDVWPWLVQMGADRAGWYSYDVVDNGGRPSATEIIGPLQQIQVGTVFPALPGARDAFLVFAAPAERHLIIGCRTPDGSPLMTWTFVLEASSGGTRLIVRARGTRQYRFHGLPPWLSKPTVQIVHGIMERKQLLGIAARAESHPAMLLPAAVRERERKRA